MDAIWQGLIDVVGTIAGAVFNAFLYVVIGIVWIILTPFNFLLESIFPEFSSIANNITQGFAFLDLILGRILDILYIFVPPPIVTFALSYVIVSITVPWLFWGINKGFIWYKALK